MRLPLLTLLLLTPAVKSDTLNTIAPVLNLYKFSNEHVDILADFTNGKELNLLYTTESVTKEKCVLPLVNKLEMSKVEKKNDTSYVDNNKGKVETSQNKPSASSDILVNANLSLLIVSISLVFFN